MSAPIPTLPEHPSALRRLVVGLQAIRVAMDDPGNPEAGALINTCFELEVYERLVAGIRETPEGRVLLAERPSLARGDLDLDALRALPQGSLGWHFASLFDIDNVEPFETRQPVRNDVEYLSKRYRETHDLYHVLTGYETDLLGEMELQAFVRGNLGLRSPRAIVPLGITLGALRIPYMEGTVEPTPFALRSWMERIRAARRRGAAVPPLIGVCFEDLWSIPLAEVRRTLLEPEVIAHAA